MPLQVLLIRVITVSHPESAEVEQEQFERAQKQGIISIKVYATRLFGRSGIDKPDGDTIYEEDQVVGKKAHVKMGLTHGFKYVS